MSHAITADYSLKPSELTDTLSVLVEARQPAMIWGPPGCAKSQIAQQIASLAKRIYVDVRALLLDRVDLMGIPWRDEHGRTRWAPPSFLPPSDDTRLWLVNLEELPSAVPMVQAALYQLVLDRKCGEYELPEGASLIACGNRESDRGVVHRMPTPLASVSCTWTSAPTPPTGAPGARPTASPRKCCSSSRCGRNCSINSIRSRRKRRFRAPGPGSSSPTSSRTVGGSAPRPCGR